MCQIVAPYRVLLVDDDEDLTRLLADELAHEGFGVACCASGEEALAALEAQAFQVVVLDMMLPGLSGEEVLGRIRRTSSVPVLILTARDERSLMVRMLRAGADDYLVKPFYPDEFLARVYALVRRCALLQAPAAAARSTEVDIAVDVPSRRVTVRGTDLALTRREFDVLSVLAERPGVVRTKAQLLEEVWGEAAQVNGEVVTVAVSRLRSALADAGLPHAIETLRGIGYRVAHTVTVAVERPAGNGRVL